MMDKVQVLRVLYYSGDRAAVQAHLKDTLKGEKTFEVFANSRRDSPSLGTMTIRAATLGEFPDVIESEET